MKNRTKIGLSLIVLAAAVVGGIYIYKTLEELSESLDLSNLEFDDYNIWGVSDEENIK